MITLNYNQFHRLMLPMPHEFNAKKVMQALEDKYGIKEMKAIEPNKLRTSWDVYFVSVYAEMFFRITYADIIC